jgi:hypothetical protein
MIMRQMIVTVTMRVMKMRTMRITMRTRTIKMMSVNPKALAQRIYPLSRHPPILLLRLTLPLLVSPLSLPWNNVWLQWSRSYLPSIELESSCWKHSIARMSTRARY